MGVELRSAASISLCRTAWGGVGSGLVTQTDTNPIRRQVLVPGARMQCWLDSPDSSKTTTHPSLIPPSMDKDGTLVG